MEQPQLAAAVILLRAAEPRGFEVYLERRGAIDAGAYGLPETLLRKEDCADVLARRTTGLTPARAQKVIGAHFPPRRALGLWIAAVRGLFEATGFLPAAGNTDKRPAADAHFRARHEGTSFRALLEAADLCCDLSRVIHFSRWRAPTRQAASCEVHFFLAFLPPASASPAPAWDVGHGLWLCPDTALLRFHRGELALPFPIFASLRTLADFDSMDGLQQQFGASP